jgi:hypothetical protein
MRPSQLGKLDIKPLVNKETAVIKLNRSATLLKAFAEHLAHKNTTIYFLGDNAH